MAKPMNDADLVRRVLDHLAAGTTDLGDTVWQEPVENYRSPERFAREMELLRSLPTVFCPSAALPAPGAYVARVHGGAPLLAVRGADGTVRVFHNACRHRGMMLAEGDGQVRGGFVCRYHGWNYDLNGALKRIAGGSEGFPGIKVCDHGLVPLDAQECAGFVFVSHKPPVSPGALESLPDILLPDQRVFDHTTFIDEANWKLLEEFAMEGYHIKTLHHESFYPYGYDNQNVVETFGPNSRITFPFRRIEKQRALPPHERRAIGNGTYTTQVFPNARVSILTNHYQVVILEPISPAQTRWHLYRLTLPGDSQTDEALERAKRDAAFVKDSGLLEDRAAALSAQASLAGQGNTHFTFGLFEKAAVHFHQSLDEHLARMQARS